MTRSLAGSAALLSALGVALVLRADLLLGHRSLTHQTRELMAAAPLFAAVLLAAGAVGAASLLVRGTRGVAAAALGVTAVALLLWGGALLHELGPAFTWGGSVLAPE